MAWDTPSPRARELIRQGAEIARAAPPEWLRELDAGTLSAQNMSVVAEDPELRESIRRSNLSNLMRWAEANAARPGEPVAANLSNELLQSARNLVRRGLDQQALDGYRGGQNAAWIRWMQIVFGLTTDAAEIREVLDITARSISEFVDATIRAVAREVRKEREELINGSNAERRETVTLLIDGAPIALELAQSRLGYRLERHHTAVIVWSEDANPETQFLERAARQLAERAEAKHLLSVVVSAGTVWGWMDAPVHASDEIRDLGGNIRVATGSRAAGVEGFRRSHLEAVTTQRILARLKSQRVVAAFEEVELVSLVTNDPARSDEFVSRTLGDLSSADADTREVLRVYLHEQSSVARTSARLHAHRNTVLRRLNRAQELLPRPLESSALEVGVALEVLYWQT
jgi:DNA-binding PucR family transcriptional regulator